MYFYSNHLLLMSGIHFGMTIPPSVIAPDTYGYVVHTVSAITPLIWDTSNTEAHPWVTGGHVSLVTQSYI